MPKVYGPLFSIDARGSLAQAIVYSSWKGLSVVKTWTSPYNPKSPGQTAQRNLFANAIAGWHAISGAQQAAWNAYANTVSTNLNPVSGFNCFISAYIENHDYPPEP